MGILEHFREVLQESFLHELSLPNPQNITKQAFQNFFNRFNSVLGALGLKLIVTELEPKGITIPEYDEKYITDLFAKSCIDFADLLPDKSIEVFIDAMLAVPEIAQKLQKLQSIKGSKYQDSWQKRGEIVSIFGNVARKFDRLENIMALLQTGSSHESLMADGEEPIIETVVDLANYSILWVAFIRVMRPKEYDLWLKRNNL